MRMLVLSMPDSVYSELELHAVGKGFGTTKAAVAFTWYAINQQTKKNALTDDERANAGKIIKSMRPGAMEPQPVGNGAKGEGERT